MSLIIIVELCFDCAKPNVAAKVVPNAVLNGVTALESVPVAELWYSRLAFTGCEWKGAMLSILPSVLMLGATIASREELY